MCSLGRNSLSNSTSASPESRCGSRTAEPSGANASPRGRQATCPLQECRDLRVLPSDPTASPPSAPSTPRPATPLPSLPPPPTRGATLPPTRSARWTCSMTTTTIRRPVVTLPVLSTPTTIPSWGRNTGTSTPWACSHLTSDTTRSS